MFGELIAIIAPVFFCAALGFTWHKQGRPYDTELVTTLVTNIGGPALVFSTLTRVELDIATFGTMAFAATLAMAGFAVISLIILRLFNLEVRSYVPSMMFPNTGNMGLPLCLFAFGDAGLALAIVYFTMAAVGQMTFGVAISSGETSVKGLRRIPILYAVFAALIFITSDIAVPKTVANIAELLGGMTIPMMLITLGISLAKIEVSSLKRSFLLSIMRLTTGFIIGVGLAEMLGFEGVARGVLILQSAMPVAVFNYLFAQRYNRSPEEVAGMVVISTAVSFVTMPALLWYVL